MALPTVDHRLESVNALRAIQRDWLKATRERVVAGEPFALCNGDECEELFIAMGVPVLAINYWNYLIAAQGKTSHFTALLNARDYPGRHFFALALAATIEPKEAPWGGLPKASLVVGSTRYESEMRVTELWARELGCPCFPLDFSFSSPHFKPLPADWWNWTRDRWEALVDPNRLDFRVQQELALIRFTEQLTGRRFSVGELMRSMTLINEQMDYWAAARWMIAETKPCPVHIRDQMSIYQAMWHRGTPQGVALIKNYHDEIKERVRKGVGAYRKERFRFYYDVQVPPWHQRIEDEFGAVTVACYYTGVPDLYARNVHDGDPMRALAARHLFLFAAGPARIVKEASDHQCDAIISVEPNTGTYPSVERLAAEEAGIPFLAVPRDADDDEVVGLIGDFIKTRLM
jgi:hypothetical protein